MPPAVCRRHGVITTLAHGHFACANVTRRGVTFSAARLAGPRSWTFVQFARPGIGWFHPFFFLFLLVLIALAVVAVVAIVRGAGRGHRHPHAGWGPRAGASTSAAESILAERLAKGEIDEDEFRSRLAALREGSGRTP